MRRFPIRCAISAALTLICLSVLYRPRSAGSAASEYDDLYSSNVSPQAGPGSGPVRITTTQLGAMCPALLLDKAGKILAYCRDMKSKQDSLRLLDPGGLATLASLDMPAPSGKMAGFHIYETQDDYLALGAGNHILRVAHTQESGAHWQFKIANDWDVSQNITAHCGSSTCDELKSVMPDSSGKIWFSSEGGVVGTVDPKTGTLRTTPLPEGEHVANSVSASPAGVAVPTDHALYLLNAKSDGTPNIIWREPYDPVSKPEASQSSQATGSSPVFFGAESHPYLTIIDNGDTRENLLVYRVTSEAGKRLVCKVPLFSASKSADGNALIGYRDGVVLSNNFGFDYGGDSGKGLELLPGGLTRIDVRDDGSGCDAIWTNSVRTVSLPILSAADGRVYTVARTVAELKPLYTFTVIDYSTGVTLRQTPVGESYSADKFLLAPLIGPNQTLYQPTSTAIITISPENPSH
jgi:hypothetical protein